jgi:Xaa-Pro aminopeptidase
MVAQFASEDALQQGPALRAIRKARVLAMMEEQGFDLCIFGRESNVKYVSGAQRLWMPGARNFAPTCLVVRETGQVHLMSFAPTQEGIPPEIRPEHQFLVTWAPGNFLDKLRAIPGVETARRIGVDGMSPFFSESLPELFASCEFLDAQAPLAQVRRVKLPGEIVQIRHAAAVAEGAVGAAAALAAPGVFEHELHAAFLARMYELGATAFSACGPFAILDGDNENALGGRRMIEDGSLVAVGGGVLFGEGYEGCVARTLWCGTRGNRPTRAQQELHGHWRRAVDGIIASCRPGNDGTDISKSSRNVGDNYIRSFVVRSTGFGSEGLIAASGLDEAYERAQKVEANMVLAVRVAIALGGGIYLGDEMVLVTDKGPELLTGMWSGVLEAA